MTNGTIPAEPGLNAELTEDQLFAQIQETMKSGTEADLNKVMESKLAEPVEVVETQPESQPAPVAAATEEVKPVEAVVPAPAQEDWFAALPADVQEKVNALKEEKLKLEHKIRSDEGRVPSLQRQNEELKRKLQGQRPEPQAAPAPDAQSKSKLDEKIAAIREVDPVLADTLLSLKEELAAPIREEVISRTEEIKSDLRQKDDEDLWNRENSKLLAAVPLAHEVFKHPQYKQWKEQQTEGILALATSIYAEDVLVAFDKFSKDMAKLHPQVVAPAATEVETPTATAKPAVDTKTNNVVLERERKLNASAPAAVSGAAKTGDGIPDDEDKLFAHFQEQIRLKKM